MTSFLSDSADQPNLVQHAAKLPALDTESWATVSSYLPGTLVEAMSRFPDRKPPWIEQIEGSLLLSDISGFTRLSEGLAESGKEGAERLTNLMNEYFHMVLDIARSYGGSNLKFGGDALLLLFQGANHAGRAVATGLGMRRATQKFTFRLERSRLRLNMTLGVHSGTFYFAVGGIPGQRMQHFILGEGVNRIAQVQASAATGQLLITESVFNLLNGSAVTEQLGDVYRIVRLSKRIVPSIGEKKTVTMPRSAQELLAYIPPPITQALHSQGGVNNIEGEHRKVTIAFINLLSVNERLAEKGADTLLNELQKYLSCVIRLAHQYGGFLVSNDIYTSGIKLIVIFGAPVAHEHDSTNALRFALGLRQERYHLKIHLTHRIGVNSGFVFAGDVGAPYRHEYTVMGDAVNLAARLMSSATPGQILVSRATANEAGPGIVVQELTPIRVKGKREPVAICSAEFERSLAPGTTKQSNTIFGRDAEVKSFQHLCQEVEQGEGRVVVISGNAGIGKSRLLAEFQEYLQSPNWMVHHGAAYSYTSAKPFAPWISVLNSVFQIAHEERAEVRTRKVTDTIQQLLPNLVEMACLLNPILALNIPLSDVVRSIDDETKRERFFDLVTALLRLISKDSPVAVIIEDIHWTDNSSLELINHISRNLRGEHLLLCLTHRPKADMLLSLPDDSTTTFALSELPQDTALQMVNKILEQRELPESITKVIVSKAQGNPLFLEEIAISLRQSGAIERLKNLSPLQLAGQIALLNIPDRVQSLIMARIDTLDENMKQTLRVASVIGDTFDVPTLAALLNLPKYEPLENQLQKLTQLDLAHPEEGAPELTYRFKHALIREVAYDSLLFSRRRELHHSVASYLENRYQEQLEPFYDVLVHHYSQSRDAPKTRVYALKAGDKAQQMFAHEDAIEYYRRGLTTLEAGDGEVASQRSYFLERIGDSYEASGNHSEAARVYLQAVRRWTRALRQSGNLKTFSMAFGNSQPPGMRTSVLNHKIGVAYERNSDYEPALRRLEAALRKLPPRQPRQSARIIITKSLTLFRKGKYEDAIRWGQLGLTLSRRAGDRNGLAYAYNILATSYLDTGRIKKAIRCRELAIRLYEELKDLSGQAEANNNLGACYQSLGDQEKALHYYELSLALCERVRNSSNIPIAQNNVGEVLNTIGDIGDIDEAISQFQKVIEAYKNTNDPPWIYGLALVNLSRAYQRKSDYQSAFDCLGKGISVFRKAGARGLLVDAQLQESELQLATAKTNLALASCQRAVQTARALGIRPLEARGLHILGRINLALGNYEKAEANLQSSITLAERLNAGYEKGLAVFYLGKLYSTRRQEKELDRRCQQTLKQAKAIFTRLGARADLAQVIQFQTSLGL